VLFHTVEFFQFFAVVWIASRVLPHRFENLLLLAASYYFYAAWDAKFLGLVLLSTAVSYAAGRAIRAHQDAGCSRRARRWLIAGIAVNLGVLGVFKYYDFFAAGLEAGLRAAGLDVPRLTLELVVPIGISFYTFQAVSYCIDVHRRRIEPATRLSSFALYLAFFPQLLAGPIERAGALLPQIERRRRLTPEQLTEGAWLVLWGLFKKLYVADSLVAFTRWGLGADGAATGADAYLVCVALAIRVYADFSGYTDMARGCAKLLGFELSLNFRLPFFAPNPAEFWKRWHITLTRWITDYVYVPLRRRLMTRFGREAAIGLAVSVTMTAMGFWHGASAGYLVWGAVWGALLVAYRWMKAARVLPRVPTIVGASLVFHFFAFTLVLTAAPVGRCAELWSLLVTDSSASAATAQDATALLWYAWPLLLVQVCQALGRDLAVIGRAPVLARGVVYATAIVVLATTHQVRGEEFIYYAF
jgi:D-alanyl-lipoteichoic acid acyltransferase DltB (MBOAT superfamily)